LAIGGLTLWPADWSASPVAAAIVLAGLAVAAFVAAERAAKRSRRDPLIDPSLFARRSFSGGLLTAATVVMAQAGTMFVLAVFLQTSHHLTAADAGRWLLPVGAAALAGAQVGGRRAADAGPTSVVRTGIVVELAGVLAAAALLHPDVGWMSLGVALAGFGFGAGMASSQLTNVILSEVPGERAGLAGGVATTNSAIGAAMGVAVLGAVLRLGTFDGSAARWALITAGVLLVGGAAASLVLPGTQALPEPTAAVNMPGGPDGEGTLVEVGTHGAAWGSGPSAQ